MIKNTGDFQTKKSSPNFGLEIQKNTSKFFKITCDD